ncbi:MAG: dephospho-CoA kinase [Elusimicrobiota bacterium]|nr:dephospho-CoA kinase [Elusimicrobiota bacterium]
MRPKRFVVGLTGGIGTGKSTALAAFASLGVPTVSLDAIAHETARPGRAGWKAIKKAFPRFVGKTGAVDRAGLGAFVFSRAAARRRLERATHPVILKEMDRRLARLRGVVVVDAPLLFEAGLRGRFDAAVLVASRKQARRVMKRDGLTAAAVRRRMAAQWPLARKRALADLTLDNDRTVADLKKQVKALNRGLQLLYGGTP